MYGLPFPALLLMHLESLRKKKWGQERRDQQPHPCRSQRPQWWLSSGGQAEKMRPGVLPWGRRRAAPVGRPQSCHWSPLFPLPFSPPQRPLFPPSLQSKMFPEKERNLMHLLILRHEAVGGILQVSSQCLEVCPPRVLESPSPREQPPAPRPSLPALPP